MNPHKRQRTDNGTNPYPVPRENQRPHSVYQSNVAYPPIPKQGHPGFAPQYDLDQLYASQLFDDSGNQFAYYGESGALSLLDTSFAELQPTAQSTQSSKDLAFNTS